MQALGLPGLAVDVEGQAVLAAIGQPLIEAEAVALGLGDFLAALVEEHLVIEALGRPGAEDARDLARMGDRIDQILAGHFIIDAERDPAHRPVDLPLQLGEAGERGLGDAGAVLVGEGDGAGVRVDDFDRDLEHAAGRGRDRQHRRIGLAALLAQGRQHHAEDVVPMAEDVADRLVEAAAGIAVGRRQEFIVEAEAVEEFAEHRIIVVGEAFVRSERVGDSGQRLAEIFAEHLRIGDIVGDLAQPVHVVAERDQPGRQPGQRSHRHGGRRWCAALR